jgi:hypothetical protein
MSDASVNDASGPQADSQIQDVAETERHFARVHREILRQGQEIECFIQKASAKQKSPELIGSMTALFELFKSEVALNHALRTELEKERGRRERLEAVPRQECATFLRVISDAAGVDLATLEHATRLVLKLIRDLKLRIPDRRAFDEERLQAALDLAQATVRAENAENVSCELHNHLQALQREIASIRTIVHKKKAKIGALKAKIAELGVLHSAELAAAQMNVQASERAGESLRQELDRKPASRADSSSQSSTTDFERFAQNAKTKIARLRRERQEAQTELSRQAKRQAATLAKVSKLEAALHRLQAVHPAPIPKSAGPPSLISELHSLSKGVSALEQRNADLTHLVDRYSRVE